MENPSMAASVNTSNGLFRTKTLFAVELHPSTVADVEEGVRRQLNLNLLRYVEEINGVLLSYSNLEILTKKPLIHPYFPYFHLDVRADVLVFRPTPGMTLVGQVNSLGDDYIGALVLGVFNVTVPARNVMEELTFVREEYKWVHSLEPEHQIADSSYIVFRVEEMRDHGGYLQIVGTMRDPGTGALDFLHPGLELPAPAPGWLSGLEDGEPAAADADNDGGIPAQAQACDQAAAAATPAAAKGAKEAKDGKHRKRKREAEADGDADGQGTKRHKKHDKQGKGQEGGREAEPMQAAQATPSGQAADGKAAKSEKKRARAEAAQATPARAAEEKGQGKETGKKDKKEKDKDKDKRKDKEKGSSKKDGGSGKPTEHLANGGPVAFSTLAAGAKAHAAGGAVPPATASPAKHGGTQATQRRAHSAEHANGGVGTSGKGADEGTLVDGPAAMGGGGEKKHQKEKDKDGGKKDKKGKDKSAVKEKKEKDTEKREDKDKVKEQEKVKGEKEDAAGKSAKKKAKSSSKKEKSERKEKSGKGEGSAKKSKANGKEEQAGG